MLLYFTVTFSVHGNRKDGEDNSVLLMTYSLHCCFSALHDFGLVQPWHYTSTREALKNMSLLSESNVLQSSQTNVQLQTSKHKASETLESKLPSFVLLHVLNPMI